MKPASVPPFTNRWPTALSAIPFCARTVAQEGALDGRLGVGAAAPPDAHLDVLDDVALDLDARLLGDDLPRLDGGDPLHAPARLGHGTPAAVEQDAAVRLVEPLLLLDLRAAQPQDVLARGLARHDAVQRLGREHHPARPRTR